MIGLSGRILLAAAAVVFGLAVFWVRGSVDSITGFSLQAPSEVNVPIFEPVDEAPTANRPEDYVPEPILVPASTQTLPIETAEIAADPQVSEAGEVVKREPLAEGSKKLDEATEKDGSLRGAFGSSASSPEGPILLQTESPLSDYSTSFESPFSENTPALFQGPTQPTAEPYTDETLLPAPPQTATYDTPTSTEETSPQPPEPVLDTETSTLPPEPSGEITSPSYLPADSLPFAEDTADLE